MSTSESNSNRVVKTLAPDFLGVGVYYEDYWILFRYPSALKIDPSDIPYPPDLVHESFRSVGSILDADGGSKSCAETHRSMVENAVSLLFGLIPPVIHAVDEFDDKARRLRRWLDGAAHGKFLCRRIVGQGTQRPSVHFVTPITFSGSSLFGVGSNDFMLAA